MKSDDKIVPKKKFSKKKASQIASCIAYKYDSVYQYNSGM